MIWRNNSFWFLVFRFSKKQKQSQNQIPGPINRIWYHKLNNVPYTIMQV